jgi:hypothetical protein
MSSRSCLRVCGCFPRLIRTLIVIRSSAVFISGDFVDIVIGRLIKGGLMVFLKSMIEATSEVVDSWRSVWNSEPSDDLIDRGVRLRLVLVINLLPMRVEPTAATPAALRPRRTASS